MKEFWKGKTVLVTGHTGFKGSWLTLWLQSMGAKVIGYSLAPPSKPSLFELANVAEGIIDIRADIRDPAALDAAFQRYQPEIVFHLAAQPLVLDSYHNPVETYSTNVMGSLYVLEAARKVRFVRAIIMVTSDKCYENKEWIWPYRESDSMGGFDPYSNSKGCAELLIHSYRQSFFSVETYDSHQVGLASVRAGNVIGGGDFAKHRLIPDIIRALLNNQKVMLRHPDAIRPWQHVLEPLSGYLLLAERLYNDKTFSEGWNFGPSDFDAQPVSDIVDKILSMWPNHKGWEVEPGAKPHEAHYLKLDCSKARTYLGYSPSWDLVRGLEKIIEWYQAYASHNDMRQISLRHIQEFQSK